MENIHTQTSLPSSSICLQVLRVAAGSKACSIYLIKAPWLTTVGCIFWIEHQQVHKIEDMGIRWVHNISECLVSIVFSWVKILNILFDFVLDQQWLSTINGNTEIGKNKNKTQHYIIIERTWRVETVLHIPLLIFRCWSFSRFFETILYSLAPLYKMYAHL